MQLLHIELADKFETAGALKFERTFSSAQCADILLATILMAQQGENKSHGARNLLTYPWCQSIATQLLAHPALHALLPQNAVAVQCNYFEKNTANNWAVAMHQDTIFPMAARVTHPALRGWSVKHGQQFAQAPAEVLAQMVALRLHLDHCGETNGALRVIAGSHRRGVLSAADIAAENATERDAIICTADVGDVWAMRPLVLHASSRVISMAAASAMSPLERNKRRVLHFVFGPAALPYGLSWPKFNSEVV